MSFQPQTNYTSKPERGGCLSIWLALSALLNVLAFLALVGLVSTAERRGLGFVIYLLLGATLVSLVCIYGMYNWKRWGVYGVAAISIISPIVQIIVGIATVRDYVAPFIQLGVLYYLVKDKWDHFD